MTLRFFAIVALLAIGCGSGIQAKQSAVAQEPQRGCSTVEECKALWNEANDRVGNCKSPFTCDAYERDRDKVRQMLSDAQKLEQKRQDEEHRLVVEKARQEMEAKKQAYKDERAAKAAAKEAEYQERRDREAAEQRAREERLADLQHKATLKEYAVPVISTIICDLEGAVQSCKADLQHEKKLERQSGVIDMAARRSIVEDMDRTQEEIRDWKDVLRRAYKASSEKCGKLHEQIMECYSGSATGDECEDPIRTYVDIWREAKGALRNGPEDEAEPDHPSSQKETQGQTAAPALAE